MSGPRALPILTVLCSIAACATATRRGGDVASSSGVSTAHTELVFDLSKYDPGSSNRQPRVGAGPFQLAVANRLTNAKFVYSVDVRIENDVIAALDLPISKPFKVSELPDTCSAALAAAKASLAQITDERVLPHERDTTMARVKRAGCDSAAQAVLRDDPLTEELGEVGTGQSVIATVIRTIRNGTKVDSVRWSLTFSGQPRGSWRTGYGFAFIWDAFSRNRSYSAMETSVATKYVVHEDARREPLTFVPSVFFTWLSNRSERRGLSYVASGGLGFDLTSPVVMIAPVGLNFNQNLGLQIGIAAHKQTRLFGRYEVGDPLSSNLLPEQLQHGVYRVNPFVSLSFNFSTSPFQSAPAAPAAQAPDKPKEK